MSSHLVPGDQAFYDDKQLVADLSTLNGQLSRYVLRMLDADARRTEPVSVADEQRIAQKLCTMANRLEQRAALRAAADTSSVLEPQPPGDAG